MNTLPDRLMNALAAMGYYPEREYDDNINATNVTVTIFEHPQHEILVRTAQSKRTDVQRVDIQLFKNGFMNEEGFWNLQAIQKPECVSFAMKPGVSFFNSDNSDIAYQISVIQIGLSKIQPTDEDSEEDSE